MFSTGHLIWIGISVLLIITGFFLCRRKRPGVDRMLRICFALGFLSELVKIYLVTKIVPVVTPALSGGTETGFVQTGAYQPYMELEHLPLEMCSLQIVFMAMALSVRDRVRKEKILSLIYATAVIGGIIAILFSSIAPEFETTAAFIASPRAWQFYLYHSMIVTLGLYLGFIPDSGVSVRHLKSTVTMIALMDIPTFYLNSVFAQPVYVNGEFTGLTYGTNFFSSYLNPLGIAITEKWQWGLYLVIRLSLALALTVLLFLMRERAALAQPADYWHNSFGG